MYDEDDSFSAAYMALVTEIWPELKNAKLETVHDGVATTNDLGSIEAQEDEQRQPATPDPTPAEQPPIIPPIPKQNTYSSQGTVSPQAIMMKPELPLFNELIFVEREAQEQEEKREGSKDSQKVPRRKGQKEYKDTKEAKQAREDASQLVKSLAKVEMLKTEFKRERKQERGKNKLAALTREYLYKNETHDHANFAKWMKRDSTGSKVNLQILLCWFIVHKPAFLKKVKAAEVAETKKVTRRPRKQKL